MTELFLVVGDRRVPWGEDLPGADDEPAAVVLAGQSPGAVLDRLRVLGTTGVVVTSSPMTDTLKLVGDDGTVLGTADREHHRLVGPPLAAPLGALRAALRADLEAAPAAGQGAATSSELLRRLAADLVVTPLE